jgi:hypothetical protein
MPKQSNSSHTQVLAENAALREEMKEDELCPQKQTLSPPG